MGALHHGERFKLIVTVELILLDNNKVLLLRRHGTGWRDGTYGLIGGSIDGNESVIDAVIREAHEEANIKLLPEWLTMATVMHAKVPELETVDFFFISKQWEGTIANNEPHKHDELGFFSLEQLPEPLMPHSKSGLFHALQGNRFILDGW